MLFLGLAIIAVYYFLGETEVKPGWQLSKATLSNYQTEAFEKDTYIKTSTHCYTGFGKYSIKDNKLWLLQSNNVPIKIHDSVDQNFICLPQGVYFVTLSRYQSKLFYHDKKQLIKIAHPIQMGKILAYNPITKAIIIAEGSRNRILFIKNQNIN